jgi:hypothetical protein
MAVLGAAMSKQPFSAEQHTRDSERLKAVLVSLGVGGVKSNGEVGELKLCLFGESRVRLQPRIFFIPPRPRQTHDACICWSQTSRNRNSKPAAMPKVPRPAQPDQRHNPLADEYTASSFKQKTPKKRNRRDEDDEDHVIDTKASRKILKIGQDLADEDEAERKARFPAPLNPAFAFESRFGNEVHSEEEEEVEKEERGEDEEAWGDEEEVFEVEVGTAASPALKD